MVDVDCTFRYAKSKICRHLDTGEISEKKNASANGRRSPQRNGGATGFGTGLDRFDPKRFAITT
jgi:hypothetical protein